MKNNVTTGTKRVLHLNPSSVWCVFSRKPAKLPHSRTFYWVTATPQVDRRLVLIYSGNPLSRFCLFWILADFFMKCRWLCLRALQFKLHHPGRKQAASALQGSSSERSDPPTSSVTYVMLMKVAWSGDLLLCFKSQSVYACVCVCARVCAVILLI